MDNRRDEETVPAGRSPRALAAAAALAIGVGLGLQSRALGKIAARLGLGTPEDDAVFAAVFALLLGLGWVAIGLSLGRRGSGPLAVFGLASAAANLFHLTVLSSITRPQGFRSLCERFGLDRALAGTLEVDALVALVALSVPALLGGAAGYAAGTTLRRGLFAIGLLLGALAHAPAFALLADARGSAGLVAFGALPVAAGALLAAWRGIAIAGPIALVASSFLLPIGAIEVRRPWARFPIDPLASFETMHGQFTVEEARNVRRALFDQRPVSPAEEELALEAACLARLFEAACPDGAPGPLSVLLFGLPTPERAGLLRAAGVDRICATGAWWRSMPRVAAAVAGERPLDVEIVPPNEPGPFDLVLALPYGAQLACGFDLALIGRRPEPTWVWLAPDRTLPEAALRVDAHLLASAGLEDFAVGVVFDLPAGPPSLPPWRVRPRTYRGHTALERLGLREEARARAAWSVYARSMASTASPSPFEQGLAALAASQRASSPFERPLERIELDAETLAYLFAGDVRDRFERTVLEDAARALEAQGEVEWIFEYVAPRAAGRAPWPALEAAVAWAESQSLRHEAAAARLAPLVETSGAPAWLVARYADALLQGGRAEEAVTALRRIAAVGADRSYRVQLADALDAARAPEARAIASALQPDEQTNPVLFDLARGVRAARVPPE